MNREIDIKALVSHIVKGDGIDKCRICMGDTQDGQVHLGDTVMLDGEKPVTLAELLAIITGVQVEYGDELPSKLCPSCHQEIDRVFNFRNFCQKAFKYWNNAFNIDTIVTPASHKRGATMIIDIRSNSLLCKFKVCGQDQRLQDNNDSSTNKITLFPEKKQTFFSECPVCGKQLRNSREAMKHVNASNDWRSCTICGLVTSTDMLLQHVLDHNIEEAYQCDRCDNVFISKAHYDKHKPNPSLLVCPQCCDSFSNAICLKDHSKYHKSKICSSCGTVWNSSCYSHHIKSCSSIESLGKTDTDQKIKKFVAECPDCKKNIASVKEGLMHLKLSDTWRICRVCYCIVQKEMLLKHITSHNVGNVYPCMNCKDVFTSLDNLTEHRQKYEDPSRFPCSICCYTSATKKTLKTHCKSHNGKHCPGCKRKFTSWCYRYHVKNCYLVQSMAMANAGKSKNKNNTSIYTGPKFREAICDYCNKSYKKKYNLSFHIKIAHDKTMKHKPCNYCGKLIRPKRMSQHILIKHTTRKMVPCEICGRGYLTKVGLTQHMLIAHTGEKPFKCQFCGEGFTGPNRRSAHINKVHKIKKKPLSHQCGLCVWAFASEYQLKKHKQKVHGMFMYDKIYNCDLCPEVFYTVQAVLNHKRSLHIKDMEINIRMDKIVPLDLSI